MKPPHNRPLYGPPAQALLLLVGVCFLIAGAQPLASQEEHPPTTVPANSQSPKTRSEFTSAVEQTLRQAEQALENQELQLAESLYQDTLHQGWLLMSALEQVDGNSTAARDALQAATLVVVTTSNPVPEATLADLSQADRSTLRDLITATMGQVYRNLGVLAEISRRPQQAAKHLAQADALEAADSGRTETADNLALVDLRRAPPTAELVVKPLPPGEDEEQLAAQIATSSADLTLDKAAAQHTSHLHQKLGRLHLTRGNAEQAATELRTAAALGTLDLDLGLKLADLEVAASDSGGALQMLQALTTTYSSPRALLKLAELTWPTGPPKSLPILLQALALAPNSEEILGNTANAYLAASEPQKALDTLIPLRTLNPDSVIYVRLLGEAYTKLGRLEEATTTLRQAIAMEPTYMPSRIHLAGVLLHMKRFDEAETELRAILADDPARPEAKDLLEYLEQVRSSSQPGEPNQHP